MPAGKGKAAKPSKPPKLRSRLEIPRNPLRISAAGAAAGFTVRRSPEAAKRKIARRENARRALGELAPGIDRWVLSKGQFSLIEFLEALLDQTGPARLTISTWTAAGTDLSEARALMESGRIAQCRFLVDFTFQRRKPAFCGQMRELFGDSAVRVTRNHAKFAVLRNEAWDIVLSTSANLNTNPRLELFQVRDDPGLAGWLEGFVDDLFERKGEKEIDRAEAKWHKRRFLDD